MSQAQYAAPPPSQSNAAGLIGFILSLAGLILGVTAPIGAIVSLIGLRNEPKGLAIAGTIIGLVLTLIWGIIWLVFGTVFLACVGVTQAVGTFGQTELAISQARTAIEARKLQDNALPSAAVGNDLIDDLKDGWGHKLRYEPDPDGNDYVIRSAGADGQFDTADDREERASLASMRMSDDSSMLDDSSGFDSGPKTDAEPDTDGANTGPGADNGGNPGDDGT